MAECTRDFKDIWFPQNHRFSKFIFVSMWFEVRDTDKQKCVAFRLDHDGKIVNSSWSFFNYMGPGWIANHDYRGCSRTASMSPYTFAIKIMSEMRSRKSNICRSNIKQTSIHVLKTFNFSSCEG